MGVAERMRRSFEKSMVHPMRIIFAVATLIILSAPMAAHAGPAADNCGDLMIRLQACQPYSCEFERAASTDNPTMINARYEVTGRKGDGCGYAVSLDGTKIMECSLSPESVDTVARIAEMQLDGSYQENKDKLVAAMKALDPETGQMDPDAMSSIDPEFMELNNKFASVIGTECQ